MSRNLCQTITEQSYIFFHNFKTCIKTCNLDYILCDMPVWKHVYHALHSCDRWFINPFVYEEPPFHKEGLGSLDILPEGSALSREELLKYLNDIENKILAYLEGLTDEDLEGKPEDCKYSRLELVLGQYRHWYGHLGNINATTIMEKGLWPKVVGLEGGITSDLYE